MKKNVVTQAEENILEFSARCRFSEKQLDILASCSFQLMVTRTGERADVVLMMVNMYHG